MPVTPAQLVHTLVNFHPDRSRPMDPTQLSLTTKSTMEAFDLPKDGQRAFFEESAALYLRQVMDVYMCMDVSGGYEVAAAAHQALWLRHIMGETAAGARFAREFPFESRHLSRVVLDQISQLPDYVFTDIGADHYLLPFVDLFHFTISSPGLASRQLTFHVSNSTLDHVSNSTLERIWPRMAYIQHLVDNRSIPLENHKLVSLAYLLNLVPLQYGCDANLEVGWSEQLLTGWRSCELLRDGRDHHAEEGTVRCVEGIEMVVCGQCHAVRYCCREHPKAHLERHKLFCFKPAW